MDIAQPLKLNLQLDALSLPVYLHGSELRSTTWFSNLPCSSTLSHLSCYGYEAKKTGSDVRVSGNETCGSSDHLGEARTPPIGSAFHGSKGAGCACQDDFPSLGANQKRDDR